jgi:hypothetical protein
MGEHIDKYRRRLQRNGNNVGEVYANNTIAFIEATFASSPTFRVVGVSSFEKPDVNEIDARVVEVERMGSLREILFRPSSVGLNVGTYITFDNETWLIFDKFGKNKVLVEQCNRTLKWRDKDNSIIEVNCIASSMDLGSKAKQSKNEIEWNKFDVRLPLGQLFVFVELNNFTHKIKLNQRFIFGSKVYEVVGIDDTTSINKSGFGVLQLTVKVDTIKEEDDFENRIALNRYDDVSTVIPTEGNSETGEGGSIW